MNSNSTTARGSSSASSHAGTEVRPSEHTLGRVPNARAAALCSQSVGISVVA